LIKFIYGKHPPRRKAGAKPDDKENKAGEASHSHPTALKKRLRKALVDYHPDKQHHMKEQDVEWFVVAEEITKHLNAFYQYQKF
jgi:DnaJ-domain-containing protein 1